MASEHLTTEKRALTANASKRQLSLPALLAKAPITKVNWRKQRENTFFMCCHGEIETSVFGDQISLMTSHYVEHFCGA